MHLPVLLTRESGDGPSAPLQYRCRLHLEEQLWRRLRLIESESTVLAIAQLPHTFALPSILVPSAVVLASRSLAESALSPSKPLRDMGQAVSIQRRQLIDGGPDLPRSWWS